MLHGQKVLVLFLYLDISKAFDLVSWAFLLEVLSHLGFDPIRCNVTSNLMNFQKYVDSFSMENSETP